MQCDLRHTYLLNCSVSAHRRDTLAFRQSNTFLHRQHPTTTFDLSGQTIRRCRWSCKK